MKSSTISKKQTALEDCKAWLAGLSDEELLIVREIVATRGRKKVVDALKGCR